MTKEEKVVFLKNPNRVLEQLIKNFINEMSKIKEPNWTMEIIGKNLW